MAADIRPSDLTMLKTATLDLVKACGGLERCAALCGVSKTFVASWYSETTDDAEKINLRTIPSLATLILERDLAERGVMRRPVSECMARLQATDNEVRTSAQLAPKLAEFASRAGSTISIGVEALADGKITPSEAKMIDRELEAVIDTSTAMRASIAAVRSRDEDGEGA